MNSGRVEQLHTEDGRNGSGYKAECAHRQPDQYVCLQWRPYLFVDARS